jgi:hypothetical protein
MASNPIPDKTLQAALAEVEAELAEMAKAEKENALKKAREESSGQRFARVGLRLSVRFGGRRRGWWLGSRRRSASGGWRRAPLRPPLVLRAPTPLRARLLRPVTRPLLVRARCPRWSRSWPSTASSRPRS